MRVAYISEYDQISCGITNVAIILEIESGGLRFGKMGCCDPLRFFELQERRERDLRICQQMP